MSWGRALLHNPECLPRVAGTVDEEVPSLASLPAPARPKAFFVGDNRSNVNWGRGASLALGQLLSASFEITGRVTGDFFDNLISPSRTYASEEELWLAASLIGRLGVMRGWSMR